MRHATFLLLIAGFLWAQTPEEGRDWPRMLRFEGGATLVLHQPQVEVWKDQQTLDARLATIVEMETGEGEFEEAFGTISVRMRTVVDMGRQTVRIESPQLTDVRFPTLKDADLERARGFVEQALDVSAREVQLEDLLAVVGTRQVETRAVEVSNKPPTILIRNEPTILVVFDGEPVFVPIEGTDLELALNTPSLLFRQVKTGWSYLFGWESWIKSRDVLEGRWVPAPTLPSAFNQLPDTDLWRSLKRKIPGKKIDKKDVPSVLVATEPTELIVTFGQPVFEPIEGTSLTYVDNTESDVFLNARDGHYYALLSGRWYRTRGDQALEFCTHDLPEDFRKIPPEHPAGRVLASVPGTGACEDALAANAIRHRGSVKRKTIELEEPFAREPRFEPVEGTEAEFATELDLDVFRVGGSYYCCADGIWFEAAEINGPWALCDKVPETLYAIPPDHPAFNDTFVVVESATPEEVTYSHTAGYYGSYPADGVVVWGTGHRSSRPRAFWLDAWKNLPYWIERWDRTELHQWHRHVTYGQGRWYDPVAGIFRVSYDAMSHAKVRRHRGEAFRSWRGKAVLPADARTIAEPEPAQEPKAKVASGRADLYAGADGKVYKREHGSWYRQDGDKWTHLSRRPWLESDEKKKQARLKRQAELQKSYDARRRSRYNRRYRNRGRRGIAYWARQPGWGWWGGGGHIAVPHGGYVGPIGGGGVSIALGGW
jgi:hypothetical protein